MTFDKIKVSEHFHSIQGEGRTVGTSAVFLRLSGCALDCVFCDTTEVWKQGVVHNTEVFAREFAKQYYAEFNAGAHLILTGGDPLIQQTAVLSLVRTVCYYCEEIHVLPEIEVETEAVLMPIRNFDADFDVHWNVSPKLSNSGMPEHRRIKPEVINFHVETSRMHGRTCFKFVVENEQEVLEAFESYIKPFSIHYRTVYLMPKCQTRAEHEALGPVIAELAKKYKVNYSPRLHLLLWDKKTGV